ncbi:hypothetical protein K493DRAFT_304049 [Basidiobolus meristosporus CBS 931.73]|uniref:EF-hand domain-containing protein n=1 Tax=Basidiobolus meristosporus CBS 931.73 TaxID=1314790 RepID=A0A1Y1Y088_9FUNG|nr:hypothetical protein K493DRAFT_304049 [Basidiobolus meristosporus CBS 931.73]|eukprot:ORX91432.1 hypothetical protein K493DRAFT_304049 [Basidiobolus meristosporus CBS 931.73]
MPLFRADTGHQSPNRKIIQLERDTSTTLQDNLEIIFTRFDCAKKGTIIAENLFPILELFEREQGISLLASEPKDLLNKFCQKNSQLELSAEDLHRLISELSSPRNACSPGSSPRSSTPQPHSALAFTHPLSPLSSRRRTTPLISKVLSTKKVAISSLRRRSLSNSGFPTKLFFDDDVKSAPSNLTEGSHPKVDDINTDSIFYNQNGFEGDSVLSFCSPLQLDMIDSIKTPKSTRHSHNNNESWGRHTIEASSWISSTSENESSFERSNDVYADLEIQAVSPSQHHQLHKMTASLNRRLLQAEKNLNLTVHQHEEQISDLQTRIDEMQKELILKRRDIQELKGREKTHLAQISLLESEVVSVTRRLSDHQNSYGDLKRQCEEKRNENEKLQQQIKVQEEELCNVEMELQTFASKQEKVFQDERVALEKHIARLEHEILFAQTLETEVNELQQDNQHLRGVIEGLRKDLDETRKSVRGNSVGEHLVYRNHPSQNLFSELALQDQDIDAQIVPNSDQNENNDANEQCKHIEGLLEENHFFKSQVDIATQKWMDAMSQLQQAKASVREEKELLLAEIERLRNSQVSVSDKDTQCDILSATSSSSDAFPQCDCSILDHGLSEVEVGSAESTPPHKKLLDNEHQNVPKDCDIELLNPNASLKTSMPRGRHCHLSSQEKNKSKEATSRALGRRPWFSSIMLYILISILVIFFARALARIPSDAVNFEPRGVSIDLHPVTSGLKRFYHACTRTPAFAAEWLNLFGEDNEAFQIPT